MSSDQPLISRRRLLSAAFGLGLFSLAAQTLVFREHLLAHRGTELGIGLFLAAWMLWIGLGSLISGVVAVRMTWRRGSSLLLVGPIALALQLGLVWSMRNLTGLSPDQAFELVPLALWTLGLTAPVSLFTGFLFPCLAALIREDQGLRVSGLYAAEAAGGCLGGILVTLALLAGLESRFLIPGLVLVWEVSALFWACPGSRRLHAAAVLALVIGVAPVSGFISRARLASLDLPAGSRILEAAETLPGHLIAAQAGGTTGFFVDGSLAVELPGEGAAEAAAVALTVARARGPALVLGLGASDVACSLVRGGISVTLVDQAPELFEMLARQGGEEFGSCISSPLFQWIPGDPLALLTRWDPGAFHLIYLGFPEPVTLGWSKYYEPDFLRLAAKVLDEDGVFTLSVSLDPNTPSLAQLSYAEAVQANLAAIFPSVGHSAGSPMEFFASASPLSLEPTALSRVFQVQLGRAFPGVPAEIFGQVFEPDRIRARARAMAAAGSGKETGGLFLLKLMADRADPDAAVTAGFLAESSTSLVLALILGGVLSGLIFFAGRRGASVLPAAGLILGGGFLGMSGQTALLVWYQVRHQALAGDFGLMNAGFMVGLALGSRLGGRLPRRFSGLFGVLAAALIPALLVPADVLGAGLSLNQARFGLAGACLAIGALSGVSLGSGTALAKAAGLSAGASAVFLGILDNLAAVAAAVLMGVGVIPLHGGAFGCLLMTPVVLAMLLFQLPGGARSRVAGMVPSPLLGTLVLIAAAALVLLPPPGNHQGATPSSSTLSLTSGSEGMRSSRDLGVEIPGYNGPIEVRFQLDDQGRIIAAGLGEHRETREYVHGLNRWLAGFKGKRAAHLVYARPELEDGVDAVSGATVSADAVTRTLAESAARLLGPGRDSSLDSAPLSSGRTLPWGPWALIVGLILTGLIFYLLPVPRLRPLLLACSVLILGYLWNAALSTGSLLGLLEHGLPHLSNQPVLVLLPALLLTGLLLGPLFCGSICPLGALQDLAGRAGLRMRPSRRLDLVLRNGKYLIALLFLVMILFGARDLADSLDPLVWGFSLRIAGPAGLAAAGLILVAAIFYPRPWCRYLCPLGALVSFGERAAVLDTLAPGRTSGACPYQVRAGVDLDCLRCTDCFSPKARIRAAGLTGNLVLVGLLALISLALGLRAGGGEEPGEPVVSVSTPQAPAPEPETSEPRVSGPRPQRRDDKQYENQRVLGEGRARELIEQGIFSGREGDFWVPVPLPSASGETPKP